MWFTRRIELYEKFSQRVGDDIWERGRRCEECVEVVFREVFQGKNDKEFKEDEGVRWL